MPEFFMPQLLIKELSTTIIKKRLKYWRKIYILSLKLESFHDTRWFCIEYICKRDSFERMNVYQQIWYLVSKERSQQILLFYTGKFYSLRLLFFNFCLFVLRNLAYIITTLGLILQIFLIFVLP